MRGGPFRILLLVLAATTLPPAPARAYKRLKYGPLEIVPSLSVEVRQHSNVYVTSEEEERANDQRPPERKIPTVDVSGFIVDVRPGITFNVKPRLEKKIRGFYVDFRYTPTFNLFPEAPELCGAPGLEPCAEGEDPTLDDFKVNHHLTGTARYQASPRFALSAGVDFNQPELSQANIHINDLTARAGAKLDFSRRQSIEAGATFKRFETPVRRILIDPLGGIEIAEELSDLGTFDSWIYNARYQLRLNPTLALGGEYSHADREFEGRPFEPGEFGPNNLNRDAVPDIRKDYVQRDVSFYAAKRLGRTASGSVQVSRIFRDAEPRQFGSSEYRLWGASGTVETLLSKRTRLQASAQYTLTDTVREIPFPELNAFTNDQTGQFSILPEQFAAAESQRYLLDLIQNVFERGDQVLIGVAYQRDRLLDQLGSQNFFLPGTADRRPLDETVCEEVDEQGARFCQTILNNQIERKFLVTAGYRVRLLRWLGVQVRGAYFRGTSKPEITDARRALPPEPPPPEEIETKYWSLAGGMVINLQVFQ